MPFTDPPGLELVRIAGWLDRVVPGLRQADLQAEVIAGGRSNLTYRLTDGTSTWALRRPPMGHVLPTAHDMAREFTVISALHGSEVPVPEPIALCTDGEVLGQPFYLMSFVDGVVLDDPAKAPDPVLARHSTEALVDTLVALHRIEPAAVGLEEFGRPDGFLARQVARWYRQFQASVPDDDSDVETDTRAEFVRTRLLEQLPASARAGIVHGDYRLTNVIYAPDLSRIAAVVDWEMATLGDPLTDLGLLYVYHERSGTADSVMPNFPSAQGFLGPDELLERYARQTGQQLDELDWYIAFGYFKLAVIAAGIHARYLLGKTVGSGFEVFGQLRDSTLAAAAERISG
ncbi:phosphotransferase family protein [Jatrophihabitans sp.]|jgi:aminoglycoside phosphotransferase (APT) family kinase protein|uniref:phosphotransferase family protein n=1 Tax=Jatrophihabitans sp. TaxID=1932789 RepID=UPI002EF5AF40